MFQSNSTTQSIILAIVLGSFVIGITLGYTIQKELSIPESKSQRLDPDKYIFTNPLLDTAESTTASLLGKDMRELKNNLERITEIARERNTIISGSIFYRDLNNGPWLLTGEQYEYEPASLFKVPLMIAFFQEAEKDPALLQKVITYEKAIENLPKHNVDSSNDTIQVGQSYSIEQLIEKMIISSDNAAAYLLLQNIDPTVVTNVFNDLDVPIKGLENSFTPFGPRTYASFMRVLYNGTYLSKTSSEKALEILSRSTFKHGIRSGLPEGTRASLKFGVAANSDGTKQLHECGIIYYEKANPYVLCIMTNGRDYDDMASYIKQVTTEIHRTVDSSAN